MFGGAAKKALRAAELRLVQAGEQEQQQQIRISQLEQELASTREQLQSAQTSNVVYDRAGSSFAEARILRNTLSLKTRLSMTISQDGCGSLVDLSEA